MANPLAPWWRPGQLFLAGAWIALGLPMGIITFVVMITLGALSIGLMPAFLLGVPVAWIAFMVARGLGRIERSRANAFAAEPIADPIPPLTRTTWLGRLS